LIYPLFATISSSSSSWLIIVVIIIIIVVVVAPAACGLCDYNSLAAWGLVTGHPFMNAGVTAITALMTRADLKGDAYLAAHGEEEYVRLVAAYSFTVGMASLVLAASGFGHLARTVPKPVRYGFKWGCAIGVLAAAVPNGLFYKGSSDLQRLAKESNVLKTLIAPLQSIFPGLGNLANIVYALLQPWLWSLVPTLMFVFGTAFCIENGPRKILPSFLPPGTDVIMVTAAAALYSHYTNFGGAVVGAIPTHYMVNNATATTTADGSGMSSSSSSFVGGRLTLPFPILNIKKLMTETPLVQQFGGSYLSLAATSLVFAAVNFLAIMGIASGFESEDGIPWSAERELVAQGVSCAVAAAVGSAPVSGSLSRSLVSRMTGTTSRLACLVTALCWIYFLPFMNVMSPTPKAALSAIIVSAVLKTIIHPTDLIQLTGTDRMVGWGTGIITAITSPSQGFGAGLVLHFVLKQLLGGSTKVKAS
jgi:MFS superfamily sulfate permease-like transporter